MCRSSGGAADHLAELVHPEREVAFGGDRRVLLAQAAGGGVARVDEQPLPVGRGDLVHPLEAGHWQVDLAPDLQHVRYHGALRRPQALGDRADGRHVRRDVLAHPPVAAGRGLDVAAALVPDAHRHAVDLQLAHVAHGLPGQAPRDPLPPCRQLVLGHRVVEAHHRHAVDDRGEEHARRAPDGLTGRVRDDQLRVGRLEIAQLPHEQVEVAVGDLRVVELVVAAVVVGDELAQGGDALGHVLRRCRVLAHAPKCEAAGDGLLVDPLADLASDVDTPGRRRRACAGRAHSAA